MYDDLTGVSFGVYLFGTQVNRDKDRDFVEGGRGYLVKDAK